MTRKEKALKHIDISGPGIEIGPSHNPLAPRKDGCNVQIIDHAGQDELREKYRGHGVNLDNIEPVDFVWRGEPYAELTGKRKHYDWVIASHLIEHVPSLIDFFTDCDDILKDDGVLSLIIPDKRCCFDHFRPLTGLAQVVDSHLGKRTVHTPGTAVEYLLNIVSKADQIVWTQGSPGDYRFIHSQDEASRALRDAQSSSSYKDYHAWCFVPHSFRLLIHDLHMLGLIPFRELDFFPTEGSEFFMTLSRKGRGTPCTRLEMLRKIEAELAENQINTGLMELKKQLDAVQEDFEQRLHSTRQAVDYGFLTLNQRLNRFRLQGLVLCSAASALVAAALLAVLLK